MQLPLAALAVISGEALVTALIWLVIVALIFWVIMYALDKMGLPEPFNKVIRVVLLLVGLLILVNFLLGIIDRPLIRW